LAWLGPCCPRSHRGMAAVRVSSARAPHPIYATFEKLSRLRSSLMITRSCWAGSYLVIRGRWELACVEAV
jgi:hypothetical protein